MQRQGAKCPQTDVLDRKVSPTWCGPEGERGNWARMAEKRGWGAWVTRFFSKTLGQSSLVKWESGKEGRRAGGREESRREERDREKGWERGRKKEGRQEKREE